MADETETAAPEITDDAVEVAALAIHNLSCATFDDPAAECAGVNHEDREQAAAAIAAARPILTGPLVEEIGALRAELADYSEQYGEQREALNRERTRMTAVADALTFGATDLVGAVTGEEVKDRAGQIVRGLVEEITRLREQADAWKAHVTHLESRLFDIWVLTERPARKCNELDHDDVCTVAELAVSPPWPAVLAETPATTTEEVQP